MGVPLGMLLAFIAAAFADSNTGVQQRAGDAGLVVSLAAEDVPGGSTNIGAVLA